MLSHLPLAVSCLFVLLLSPVLASSHGSGVGPMDHMDDLKEKFMDFDKHGEERRQWLARYEIAKSQCLWEQDVEALEYNYDWFPSDKEMRGSYWSYLSSQMLITTYYPNFPRWLVRLAHFFLGAPSHGPPLQSFSCVFSDTERGEFRLRRLGPFVGNGGFDWHKMKLEDPYNLRPVVQTGGVHVTGFTVMPVTEGGKILGNPPVHIHHANLGPNPNRSSLARISQWHGDSQCSLSEGGTACYVTALPPGFGFPVSKALRMDVDFNDVRPSQSPDLRFWLETAIHIVKPSGGKPLHDVGTVILGVPFRMQWWTKTSDFQRLYFVPSDQPTALWVTGRMPVAGTFVKGKLETHQHMFDQAWVFSGVVPEDLGLNSKTWQLRKPWEPWAPREHGWTNDTAAMQMLKSQVLSRFEKLVQRCTELSSCTKPPTLVWNLHRTVYEDGEERQMPWPNQTWAFEEDEQFTIVIFHKAMAMTHMHGVAIPAAEPVELAQHLAITGHYLPKPGSHAKHVFVLPSTRSEYSWINSVDWLSALTHCGGPDAPAGSWCWSGVGLTLSLAVLLCMVAGCGVAVLKMSLCSLMGFCNKSEDIVAGTMEIIPQSHNCKEMEEKEPYDNIAEP